ncbi:MAG: hypothetical protein ACR2RV_23395, partial [Verrucomicrobiales bacterium]
MNDKRQDEGLPPGLASKIQHYLDGEISDDAFEELEELLKDNPAARAYYRSYSNLDSNLREVAEEGSGNDNVVPIRPAGRGVGASLLQAVATFVLGAAVVYFFVGKRGGDTVADGNEPSPDKARPAAAMIDDSVATLTRAVGVEWADGTQPYRVGSVLPVDTLRINKGLLQVEFFSGAIVIVEGPAEFELVNPMMAMCHLGKTRANVPDSAHGFTIGSKHMDVVDRGTEFALVVDEDGLVEVHVFEGEVEVHEKPGGKMHNLMSGNGVRIGEGDPEFLPLNEMGFVDARHVSILANADAAEHRALWMDYSEELKAHPDVLLYYSFDEKTTWSRKLRNVRKMTADPLHGAIVGCRWSEGRWNGKGSLEFKGAGDRVRIQIPGEHDEFSLMAWVRIDGFDRELNSLMLSDNWAPGGVHWQFTRKGELILGTKRES